MQGGARARGLAPVAWVVGWATAQFFGDVVVATSVRAKGPGLIVVEDAVDVAHLSFPSRAGSFQLDVELAKSHPCGRFVHVGNGRGLPLGSALGHVVRWRGDCHVEMVPRPAAIVLGDTLHAVELTPDSRTGGSRRCPVSRPLDLAIRTTGG